MHEKLPFLAASSPLNCPPIHKLEDWAEFTTYQDFISRFDLEPCTLNVDCDISIDTKPDYY